jgi:predicted NBD/HSP70 family sugar kinase
MANQQKTDNMLNVLGALWSSPGLSRAEIARRIRIDRSTVGAVVEILLKKDIVFEERPNQYDGSSGRPPILLQLNNAYAYTVGLELAADGINGMATSLSGEILCEKSYNDDISGLELPEVIAKIIRDIEMEMTGKTLKGLQSVVLGISGIVNTERGSILASSDLHIRREYVLAEAVEKLLNVPVWVHNDADSCALGELIYGNKSLDDFLFVLVKNRIDNAVPGINAGLGIILNGNLREAHSNRGREFRSPLLPSGSGSQFLAVEKLLKGEISSEEAWLDFTEELSLSLAFLVHALDIEYIVLGGDAAGKDFETISERINHHVNFNTSIYERVPIILNKPTAGPKPVAYGASAAAAKLLFQKRLFSLENIGV